MKKGNQKKSRKRNRLVSLLIALALGIGICVSTTQATAQTFNHNEISFTDAILTNGLLLPAVGFGWISVHESSHWLALRTEGYRVTAFEPYPTTTLSGNPVLGRTAWVAPINNPPSDFVFMAPAITDTVVYLTTDLLLSTSDSIMNNKLLSVSLWTAGMVVPWTDFSFNLLGGNDEWTTEWKYIGYPLAILGLVEIVRQIVRIHSWQETKETVSTSNIQYEFSGTSLTITW